MPSTMAKKKTDSEATKPSRKPRYNIFVTLDASTEWRLKQFIASHRIKPDRASVAFTAICELLDREKIPTPTSEQLEKADLGS